MIDLDMARTGQERLALEMLKAMEDGTLMEALDALCTPDFEWANSGLKTLKGVESMKTFFAAGGFASDIPILKEMTHFSADVLHIASDGDVVFTERVDHHWAEDGRDLMTPYIAGVMEIRDGKVASLRDYYDVECYQQTPTAPDPKYTLAAMRG